MEESRKAEVALSVDADALPVPVRDALAPGTASLPSYANFWCITTVFCANVGKSPTLLSRRVRLAEVRACVVTGALPPSGIVGVEAGCGRRIRRSRRMSCMRPSRRPWGPVDRLDARPRAARQGAPDRRLRRDRPVDGGPRPGSGWT
jgi:hypothetical protein